MVPSSCQATQIPGVMQMYILLGIHILKVHTIKHRLLDPGEAKAFGIDWSCTCNPEETLCYTSLHSR